VNEVERAVTIDDLRENYPLYAEGALKIYDKRARLVPLVMNHSQITVQKAIEKLEREGKPIRLIELKARQTGLSTDAEGRIFHRCHLRPNRRAIIMAHIEESAKSIFDMTRAYYENLPGDLQLPKRYFSKRMIQFEGSHSSLRVAMANKMGGRGLTAQYLHMSECAFYVKLKQIIAAVQQSIPDDPDTMVIAESTPNGHNEFYDWWVDAKAGRNDFVPIFIPWYSDPSYVRRVPVDGIGTLDEPEQELVHRYKITDEQIQWRRWCIANNCRNDPDTFLQEYPSDDRSCFLASGRPAFDYKGSQVYITMSGLEADEVTGERAAQKLLMDLDWDEQAKSPILTTSTRQNSEHGCRLFRVPVERNRYMIGVDSSEGVKGGDRGSIAVLNRMTLDYEFFWYGWTPPEQLAVYAWWVHQWYNHAEINPEFNNHGYTVVNTLKNLGAEDYLWRRLASLEDPNAIESERVGYLTSSKTRHPLFNGMREYVRNAGDPKRKHMSGRIEDPEFVKEMIGMVYDEDRIDHLPNSRDDVVAAAALALFGHRGNEKAPIEPLAPDEVRRVLERIEQMRGPGSKLSVSEMMAAGITAEELERHDEQEQYAARAKLRRSGGLMG
jgi:hypothetical protein